ncbi:bis-aminopropyl spermidine synthase family protein [Paenibacillus lautus]|uniref:bis-aminopropyl spermidine synthase family protein n=1 Tax=Paenibacillus lautus TaxID=1401 RepID=UPI001C11C876|nr:bis-aminopropyl spermidine synthase family protein [Paenibacillus lautus]MBU5347845.1 bis-aminopropyl spermidine synthase family protein [Paenibacillus lautus]
MMNYIEEVKTKVRLQEGVQVIEQLLVASYMRPGISTKELARHTYLPVPITAAIKKELIKAGALIQERGVRCTSAGKVYVEHELGYGGIDQDLYQKLMAEEHDWQPELSDVLARLTEILEQRPQVDVQIDQSQCTVETSLRRAVLCLREHSLIGKNILCVGDDDLVSISLGLLLKRLFPNAKDQRAAITVMDIDERFLRFIQGAAAKEGLLVTCRHIDLRQPLPEGWNGQYDCFFTDPPYTLQGLTLFLSRGISALKHEKGCPIFLSFAHKSPDFTWSMQREFVRMGLSVKQVLLHFNQYIGAQMIGNSGQMIVLTTTEFTEPHITDSFEEELYTGEVRRTVRTYRCIQCQGELQVGVQGDYSTIEDLKKQGCPVCANLTFTWLAKKTI